MFKNIGQAKEFLSSFVESGGELTILTQCSCCCSGSGGGNG